MLLMTTDVCARKDFDFGKAAPVLINFDFPMTLQLYLYRIQKRADSETHVYTFFSPHDVRHANSLVIVLEGARQKVPDALKKMKDQVKAETSNASKKEKDQGHRKGKEARDEETGSKGSRQKTEGRGDRKDGRWQGDTRDARDSGRKSHEEGDRPNHRRASRQEERDGPSRRSQGQHSQHSQGKDGQWSEFDGRTASSGLGRRQGRGFSDT